MALTNIVRLAGTTHSTAGSSAAPFAPVTPEYAYDGNTSTVSQISAVFSGGIPRDFDLYSTHTFSKAYNLSSIYYKIRVTGQSASSQSIQIQYNGGAWTTLWSYGDGQYEYTQTGNWVGVTGLRAVLHTHYEHTDGYYGMLAYVFEIQGWGSIYEDSGIRYYKDSVKKIGCETLNSTHKLRVNKNGTIYGIPLLATTDAEASGVRIFDGSSVKSLPLVS